MTNMKRARAIAQEAADQERSAQTMEEAGAKLDERYAVAPTGARILGTYESIRGRADIVEQSFRREADGSLDFDYSGYTEVFWDDQRTLEHGASGERLYVDEEGELWRESQLHLVDGLGNLAPCETNREGKPYEPTAIDLNEREIATVLAALRYWQRNGDPGLGQEVKGEDDIASNRGSIAPLDTDEIDALCERLNCGG